MVHFGATSPLSTPRSVRSKCEISFLVNPEREHTPSTSDTTSTTPRVRLAPIIGSPTDVHLLQNRLPSIQQLDLPRVRSSVLATPTLGSISKFSSSSSSQLSGAPLGTPSNPPLTPSSSRPRATGQTLSRAPISQGPQRSRYMSSHKGSMTVIRYLPPSRNVLLTICNISKVAAYIKPCTCDAACTANPPDFSKLFGSKLNLFLFEDRVCRNKIPTIEHRLPSHLAEASSSTAPLPSSTLLPFQKCNAHFSGFQNVFWSCETNSLYLQCPNSRCDATWVIHGEYGQLMTRRDIAEILNMFRSRNERKRITEARGKRFPLVKEDNLLKRGMKAKREEWMGKFDWKSQGGRMARRELGMEEEYDTEGEIEEWEEDEDEDEDEEMTDIGREEDERERGNQNAPIVISSTDEEDAEEEEEAEDNDKPSSFRSSSSSDSEEDEISGMYYKGPNGEIRVRKAY